MRNGHGFGYKRDRRDDRDLQSYAAIGSDALAAPSDLSRHVVRVFEQGSTSSCVAQAIVAGIDVKMQASGLEPLRRSRLFPYYFGRPFFMRAVDMGSRPRDVLHALHKMGAPAEVDWPFDTAKVNTCPPARVRRKAADLSFCYARCPTVESVALALYSGQPVAIGLQIDEAFTLNLGPDIVRDFHPKRVGGHMMLVVGNAPEREAFLVLNSWGRDWRASGFCWLDHDLVRREAMDKWAIV